MTIVSTTTHSKAYVAPSLRPIALCEEESFLVSGGGEDANPYPGTWVIAMDEDNF